jgi:hypothetical protein
MKINRKPMKIYSPNSTDTFILFYFGFFVEQIILPGGNQAFSTPKGRPDWVVLNIH